MSTSTTLRHRRRIQWLHPAAPALICFLCLSNGHAAETGFYPGPGSYQIDSDTTTTTGSGGVSAVQLQHTDGTTGQVSMSSRSSDGSATGTKRYPGIGPNTWCVPMVGAPPPIESTSAACVGQTASPSGSSHIECGGRTIDEKWTRLGDGEWQRTIHMVRNSAAGARSVAGLAALGAAVPGVPAMPGAAERNAAMAPVIARLQAQVKSGNAKEAAFASQQLELLSNPRPASAAGAYVTDTTEHWTRLTTSCTAVKR